VEGCSFPGDVDWNLPLPQMAWAGARALEQWGRARRRLSRPRSEMDASGIKETTWGTPVSGRDQPGVRGCCDSQRLAEGRRQKAEGRRQKTEVTDSMARYCHLFASSHGAGVLSVLAGQGFLQEFISRSLTSLCRWMCGPSRAKERSTVARVHCHYRLQAGLSLLQALQVL
jgi:hypothetical protein